MNIYSTQPAVEFTLSDLADLFTRSFTGYFMPVNLSAVTLANFMRRDGIDLLTSRVLLADGQPCGLGLVARRGWNSRITALGIVEGKRGQGAGSFLTRELIREARERGERSMELEVISQNTKAIALYEKYGFVKMRRLLGFSLANPVIDKAPGTPEEIEIRTLAKQVMLHGLPDLPWQMSAETVGTFALPARAYRLEAAYALITDPALENITLWTILTETEARRQGQATRLIQSILSMHPGKTWHVPAIFSEETIGPFEKLGFVREEISQFQMRLRLG